MSGFEIAGVVLGALPLLIEAGTASYNHFKFRYLKQARSQAATKADELLYEFYLEVFYETFLLKKSLEKVFRGLPGVSPAKKDRIIACQYDDWHNDPEVTDSLKEVFDPDDLLTFLAAMEKLSGIFSKLMDEKSLKLPQDLKRHKKMSELIKNFRLTKTNGPSHFHERRRFFQKEENRQKWLKQLEKWNRRLRRVVKDCRIESQAGGKLIKTAPSKRDQVDAIESGDNDPFVQNRMLSLRMFSALSDCWQCKCSKRHEGRFSLQNCRGARQKVDPALSTGSLEFDFLVRDTLWHEATVSIKPARPKSDEQLNLKSGLKNICDAVQTVRNRGLAFRLHIWDHENFQVIQKPEICTRLLNYQPGYLTFREVLDTAKKRPSLSTRIKLAATFARSLFQLYESPWSSSRWDKDHLTFFLTSHGKPDLERPYLSTYFDQAIPQEDTPDPALFHNNAGILKLGILLIEVYKWKPIEHYRQAFDLADDGTPTANTDILVAFRMLNKLKGSDLPGYFDSVFGCLNLPWKQPGAKVTFQDATTRNGFYQTVLEPLQEELDWVEELEKKREEKKREGKRRCNRR